LKSENEVEKKREKVYKAWFTTRESSTEENLALA